MIFLKQKYHCSNVTIAHHISQYIMMLINLTVLQFCIGQCYYSEL